MRISKDARKLSKELFRASFSEGRLDPVKVRRLVQTVVESRPRRYVEVLKNYQRLVRLEVQSKQAIVESSTSLSSDATRQITQDLRQKYGRDLTTEFKVTPELIGGLRIRIGSDVWDGSVRNRLARLDQELSHP